MLAPEWSPAGRVEASGQTESRFELEEQKSPVESLEASHAGAVLAQSLRLLVVQLVREPLRQVLPP
jgi:hypothetical protein